MRFWRFCWIIQSIRFGYANCEQAQVLDVLGTDQTMVRIVVKTPFPLASRETINTVTLTRSEHSARIDLVNAPGAVPLTRGVVRMQTAGGSWVLQTVPGGTQVLQTYHADSSGQDACLDD